MGRHEAIGQCVVVAREAAGDGTQLVAYGVLRAGAGQPTVGEVQRFLGERLPGYMVPSAYVWLAALPQTASGKVDRQALPEPSGERPELAERLIPPRAAELLR